jgi:hypothetical protein
MKDIQGRDTTAIPHHNFGDVPLKVAMIAWNYGPPREDGRIVVIPHPDMEDWTDHLKLTCTTGACWNVWHTWPTQKRLLKLFIGGWHIHCRDGVPMESIHEAFMVIPEYRETLSGEPFFGREK